MSITLLPNGRALAAAKDLTSQQYATLSSQPRCYFSQKNRTFSFVPTPLGCQSLAESGLSLDHALSAEALKWAAFRAPTPYVDADYSRSLRTRPWKHQAGAIAYGRRCPSPYFDMGMGTGKSLATVGVIADAGHRRTLVLCPKAVVNVWPREFRKHSRGQFIVKPMDEATTEKKALAAERLMRSSPSDPIVFVTNYESAIQPALSQWINSQKWDCVVADEAHKLKSPDGKASRLAADINCGQPMALSGTMLPHDPLDVFAQYRFLEPAIFGTSLTMFKKRYCETGFFNEVKRFINVEELNEKINLIRYHVPSSVLDLPPATHKIMSFTLSPKVRKAYDLFKRELIAEIQGGVVTADNVLVRGLRLQQLTSGFFIDDDTGDVVTLDDRPKASAFEDWLDSVPRNSRAVVFCRFKHDVEVLKKIIERDGRRFGELSGRRNDLTGDATFPVDQCDILVANIQSGGVGVDLTAASYACYYSISWNRGEYDQSIARLVRPGQTEHVSFTHLVAEDTIDPEIYDAFSEGRDLVNAVLNGLK